MSDPPTRAINWVALNQSVRPGDLTIWVSEDGVISRNGENRTLKRFVHRSKEKL